MTRRAIAAARPLPLPARAALLLPIAAAGCADIEDPVSPPTISWAECEGSAALECGTLVVPRDHDAPHGATFELPVVRRPASDPAARIGSLVLNPGGPGASGASFARTAWILLPAGVRDRFDIVGFDPRGQAKSTPAIDCAYDIERFASLDPTPDDEAERAELLEQSRALAAGCEERSGDILPFIGTNSIVRDMDMLREALGDEKLTYLGLSYGTFLGAIYADTFPERVRALVLDGVVDPALTVEALIEGQARGFEEELTAFLGDCAADDRCLFHSGGDPASAYDEVRAAIEAAPLPAPERGGRSLGPGELAYAVAAALYRPGKWGDLADGLAAARDGDGSKLQALADGYLGRRDDGGYTNLIDVYYAVTSIDTTSSRDPAALAALTAGLEETAPRIGAYLPHSSLPSLVWPVAPWRTAGPVSAPGAPPVLVVAGTGDPATPYSSAVAVSKQLPGSALLTREARGHTSFLAGSRCIDEAVGEYLVNLTLPAPGTVCSD